MKNNIITFVLSIGMLLSSNLVSAQQINNLYFLENAPVRHYLNPAFQPLSGFYLGFPVLGYTQLGVGNNSFTISSLATPKADVFNALKPTTQLNFETQLNILDFGFRSKDSYYSFGITTKASTYVGLPKDIIKMFMYGFANEDDPLKNNQFDFTSLTLGANAYTEVALGYSKNINEKWSYGFKLKYLHGIANASATFSNFDLITGIDQWKLNANGEMKISSPASVSMGNDLSSVNTSFPSDITEFVNPAGVGGAVDLGLTYKPLSFLTIGASVTDLGMITWSKNVVNKTIKSDYTFDGLGTFNTNDLVGGLNTTTIMDDLTNDLSESTKFSNGSLSAYTTNTSPKINASAEVGILKNAISLGLLSTTMFHNNVVNQDITTSLNLRPINWFNVSLSYSLINGRSSNIGTGLGFRMGFLNAFVTTDYIPVNHSTIPYSVLNIDPDHLSSIPVFGSINGLKLPYKTDRFNFAMGFNIVFGNRKVNDKDGIIDRRDKSLETPLEVIVDKEEKPLDSDSNKVPE